MKFPNLQRLVLTSRNGGYPCQNWYRYIITNGRYGTWWGCPRWRASSVAEWWRRGSCPPPAPHCSRTHSLHHHHTYTHHTISDRLHKWDPPPASRCSRAHSPHHHHTYTVHTISDRLHDPVHHPLLTVVVLTLPTTTTPTHTNHIR